MPFDRGMVAFRSRSGASSLASGNRVIYAGSPIIEK